jgi:vacuolar fusion protein MON1
MDFSTKKVFILTSSGKPIFSNVTDEDFSVAIFSFVQAVVSVVTSSNDQLKVLKSGTTKIMLMVKKQLYFLIVSDLEESESALQRQLDFLYQYILFILTAKVHDLLENNASLDVRNLLGSDSDKILLGTGCDREITPTFLAFHALRQQLLDKVLKEEIHSAVRECVDKCGAA